MQQEVIQTGVRLMGKDRVPEAGPVLVGDDEARALVGPETFLTKIEEAQDGTKHRKQHYRQAP